jgi:hypothetical protein
MRKNKYLKVDLLGNDLEICIDYFDSDIMIFDETFTTDRFPFVGQIALAGRTRNNKLEISIRAYLYPLTNIFYNPYDFEKTDPLSLSNEYVVKNKKQFSQALLVVTEELNANAKDLVKKIKWYLD